MKLFTKPHANPKIAKSIGKYLPIILHLAPAQLSGHNVCSSSSAGCRAACLNTSGHGRYNYTQQARIKRNKWFFEDRPAFMAQLYADVYSYLRKCERENYLPCIRLNGTSDIVWETVWPDIFDNFPTVQFYDYTKHAKRFRSDWKLPTNYHLTFSRSEVNDDKCQEVLNNGGNVAVVFKELPKKYLGHKVQSGDETDLRFLDKARIIGLSPKGRAKYDKSGFVIGANA